MPRFSTRKTYRNPRLKPVLSAFFTTAIVLTAIVFTFKGVNSVQTILSKASSPVRTIVIQWNFLPGSGGYYGWNYLCVDRKFDGNRTIIYEPNSKCPGQRAIEQNFKNTKSSPIVLPVGNKYFTVEASLSTKVTSMIRQDKSSVLGESDSRQTGLFQKFLDYIYDVIFRRKESEGKDKSDDFANETNQIEVNKGGLGKLLTREHQESDIQQDEASAELDEYQRPSPTSYTVNPTPTVVLHSINVKPTDVVNISEKISTPTDIPQADSSEGSERSTLSDRVSIQFVYTLADRTTPEAAIPIELIADGKIRKYEIRFPEIGEIKISDIRLVLDNVMNNNLDLVIESIQFEKDTPLHTPTPTSIPPRDCSLIREGTCRTNCLTGEMEIAENCNPTSSRCCVPVRY